MAYVFKSINNTDKSILKSVVQKSQEVSSSADGLYVIQYRSGSKTDQYQKISQRSSSGFQS